MRGCYLYEHCHVIENVSEEPERQIKHCQLFMKSITLKCLFKLNIQFISIRYLHFLASESNLFLKYRVTIKYYKTKHLHNLNGWSNITL